MKGLIFLFAMGSVVLGQIDSTELWKHMSVEQLRVVRSNYNQEIARVNSMWNEYRDKSKNEQDLSVAQKDADRMDEAKAQLEILENNLSIVKSFLEHSVSNEQVEYEKKQDGAGNPQQESWKRMSTNQMRVQRDKYSQLNDMDNYTLIDNQIREKEAEEQKQQQLWKSMSIKQMRVIRDSLEKRGDSFGLEEVDLIDMKIGEKQNELEKQEQHASKIKKVSDKYSSSEFKDQILKHHVAIGMTKEMVIDSWGKPDDINRTVGSWGVHEQWVYGETYLYIENDTLTSFQDRK